MANLKIQPMKYTPNPLHIVPTWVEEDVVNMIIEINKGTINKYELITETGMLKVDRVGYSSLTYPFTYGAIPQTWDYDNDPLDILLAYNTESFVPGSLIEARVIGMIEVVDSNEVDDKIIAVANDDKRFSHIKDITDLPEYMLKEYKYFWEHLKDLKEEKLVQVKSFKNKQEAKSVIKKCQELYDKDYKPLIK